VLFENPSIFEPDTKQTNKRIIVKANILYPKLN